MALDHDPPKPPPQRRSRVPLSCEPCRARKLKCNREMPCQNCTARNQQAACNFRGGKGPGLSGRRNVNNADGNGDAMRNRIEKLESLVKKLMSERRDRDESPSDRDTYHALTPESIEPEPVEPPDQSKTGAGKTVVDGVLSIYQGGDDWYAVLQEIDELKKSCAPEQEYESPVTLCPILSHTVDGAGLLYNQAKPIDRVEILASLPPKAEVDRLVARFFSTETFPIVYHPIIHQETFMREYHEHWKNPSQTNLIWIGLLFAILAVSMVACGQTTEPVGYEGISQSRFQLYRMRTAQCLLGGDIAKCLPYTVEALRFNAAAELSRSDDNRRGLWIFAGVVVRVAINMGYHRDPAASGEFSALQAEFRRRVWLSVVSMDDMASFVGGFPRLTASICSDTAEPRNLHDWEIPEESECAALPPSRPLTDPTSTTYLIVKGRLLRALGRITDFNSNPNPGSYDTVLEIDRAVTEAYQDIPHQLKVLPPALADQNCAPPEFSAPNVNLVGIYYRGMCILHRRYLARARVDSRYKLSRDRCISSAIAILSYQSVLDVAYYQMSQVRQLMILAAMILCFEMELRRKAPNAEADASPSSEALLDTLTQSARYWEKAVLRSEEISRVHRALISMISSFNISGDATDASDHLSAETLPESWGAPSLFDVNSERLIPPIEDTYQMDFDWAELDCQAYGSGLKVFEGIAECYDVK